MPGELTSQTATLDVARIIGTFPATPLQQQFWFMDQVAPGDTSLNVAIRWEMRGEVHSETLERAFRYVINRHEILRTRLVEQDGVAVQEVLGTVPFRLGIVDIRTMPQSEHVARVDDIARQDAAQPFDLNRAGMLRATLVRFSVDRAMLLITAHHAVFDGYSIGILGREIGLATAAFQAGGEPDLPDLPLQYGDFALWQADYLASGVLDEAKSYWVQQLADAPYFELPTDHARSPVFDHHVASIARDMPGDFQSRLQAASQSQSVSGFTFGAAVAAAVLKGFTGADQVLFGTPIAARDEVELENLIGPMINSQILRFQSGFDTSFADHLMQARDLVNDALAHQHMPFSALVETLKPKRDPSRAPLISLNFNMQHVFMQDRDFGGVELISSPSKTPGAARDLDILIMGRPSGWRIGIEYASALFDAQTINTLLDQLQAGFDRAFDTPELPLSAWKTAERTQIQQAPAAPIRTAIADTDATDVMAGLWSEILNRTDLPRDVSFFDLGGHSLLAVRLIARVRATWDVEIGVAAIYETPTIASLTAAVAPGAIEPATAAPNDDWRIEPITTTGTGNPIITINDIGIMLAAGSHMHDPRPATCVRLFDGTRGIDQRPRSFTEIAAEYAAVVKKAQPHGPYTLFGVCVHGNIAVETARILQAQGETVTALILKDVWEPGYAARLKADRVTRTLERIYALRNRVRQLRRGRLSLSALLGNYRIIRASGVLHLAVRLGLISRLRTTDLEEEQERFIAYITAARNAYVPEPLNIPMLHVVTDITAQGPLFAPSIGWEHVIMQRLKTVHLPDVIASGGDTVGVDRLATEIEGFLADLERV